MPAHPNERSELPPEITMTTSSIGTARRAFYALAAAVALAACGGGSQRPGNTLTGNTNDGVGWELNVNPAIVDLVEGNSTTVTLTLSCTAPLSVKIDFLGINDNLGNTGLDSASGPQPDPRTIGGQGLRMDCTPAANAVTGLRVSAPAETVHKTTSLRFNVSQSGNPDRTNLSDTFAVAVQVSDAPPPPATAAPGPVLGLNAIAGLNSVRLSWQAAPQAASYTIERTDPGGQVVVLGSTSNTSHLDPNVLPDSLYVYRLTAVNVLGSSPPAQTSARTLAQAGWALVGPDIASGTAAHQPSMVLGRDGQPVVAYVEQLSADIGRLFVKRYDGANWQVVGGAALNAGSRTAASDPILVLDENDQPIVAYSQGNGVLQNIFVARFANGDWANVQAPSQPFDPLNLRAGSRAIRPAMVYTPSAGIVVAWVEDGALALRRFHSLTSDAGWQPFLPGEADPPPRVAMPAVGVRIALPNQYISYQLTVAWIESDGSNSALYVMNGGAGVAADGVVRLGWHLLAPLRPLGPQRLDQFGMFRYTGESLQPLADGSAFSVPTPTLVWADGNQPFEVYPRSWEAATAGWVADGGQPSFGYFGLTLGLMVTATQGRASNIDGFAVSYEGAGQSAIDVNRRTSLAIGGWQTAAPSLALNTQVIGLSLQFDDNDPAMATSERAFGDAATTLRVRRYIRQ
jgi:hypothetical protein